MSIYLAATVPSVVDEASDFIHNSHDTGFRDYCYIKEHLVHHHHLLLLLPFHRVSGTVD